jgi:hypothetical protein
MNDTLDTIARDLDACDLGLALTKGKLRKRYAAHKRACYAALDTVAPLDAETKAMSDDELLAALFA